MFAATAAGIYAKVEEAQEAMGKGFANEYYPNHENHKAYLALYEKYQKLGKFTEHAEPFLPMIMATLWST